MIQIIHADVMDGLAQIPAQSVQCVVTSPPYWGLRDYGVEGQIGLEKTPEEYLQKMVEVFRGVRRVLRDDGTVWLNIGDSYWGGKGQSGSGNPEEQSERYDSGVSINKSYHQIAGDGKTRPSDGKHEIIKQKDLVGIPWRLALALQADGWYLRSDIIWSKPNPMPESVTDRPTKSHEYIFLLTKNARYFYDADAVREKYLQSSIDRAKYEYNKNGINPAAAVTKNPAVKGQGIIEPNPAGRNRRTVWEIATQPFPESHFATFPEALVEPCIKAGTSERGCCPVCGAPWERVIEREVTGEVLADGSLKVSKGGRKRADAPGQEITSESSCFKTGLWKKNNTLGWLPTCSHGDITIYEPPTPCVVLDPFGGSGTVAKVARDLNRSSILIEINPEYVKIARKRLRLNEQLGVFT